MNRDEVERLVFRYFDGTATEPEIRALEALVRNDASVRDLLLSHAELDASLRHAFPAKQDLRIARKSRSHPRERRWNRPSTAPAVRRRWFWTAAAAAILLAVVLTRGTREERGPVEITRIQPKRMDPVPAIVEAPPVRTPEEMAKPEEPRPEPVPEAPPREEGNEEAVVESPRKEDPVVEVPRGTEQPEVEPEKALPEPAPSPGVTEPESVCLRVEAAEGSFEIEEGKKWRTLKMDAVSKESPWVWEAGRRIRVPSGKTPARMTLAGGESLCFVAGTTMASSVERSDLILEKGKLYCEIPPKNGNPEFRVRAGEVTMETVVASFGVHHEAGRTSVGVVSGEAVIRTSKGEARVGAGCASQVSRNGAPSAPRAADLEKMFSWRCRSAGAVTFRFDFEKEDGARIKGLPGIGPEGRRCVEGEMDKYGVALAEFDLMDLRAVVRPGARLRFRYHATGREMVVQVTCERIRQNAMICLPLSGKGTWSVAEVRLEDFVGRVDGSRLQPGDLLVWMQIGSVGEGSKAYFDDVELVDTKEP